MLEIAQGVASSDLRRAIAIVKAIPSSTSAYSSAQSSLQQWEQQLNPSPSPSPSPSENENRP